MNIEATKRNLLANEARIKSCPDIKSKTFMCKSIINRINYDDAVEESYPEVVSMCGYTQIELLNIINNLIDCFANTGKAYICFTNDMSEYKDLNDLLEIVYRLCRTDNENEN